MLEDSYFFKDLEKTEINSSPVFEKLENYSNEIQKQIYVLYKALLTKNDYSYKKACVILIQNKKILFMNFDDSDTIEFEDYYNDFLDDLGYLSEKYNYKTKLGRPRTWNQLIEKVKKDDIDNIISSNKYNCDFQDIRKIEILTSLMIGSINDPNKVPLESPDTILKKIKNKIILYDGKQSEFIYKDNVFAEDKKKITIQGLAGTGKTELLVQKIRDKYVNEPGSKIVYTCYNNVLWEDMKKRIPDLFDFMKVDEQIKLNERLWIMKAWGSANNRNSGICSYICNYYSIPFTPYSRYYELEDFSADLLKKLQSKKEKVEPCFDYIFIDESQDFGKNFIDLCELITAKRLFIAGDIFQNIFDSDFENVNADYVLNKCYRTDPKNLMFSHSIGMGLYETPVLRWLTQKEWNLCGYSVQKDNGECLLSRKPIRRFEDIEDLIDTMEIKEISENTLCDSVISTIKNIKSGNSDILPSDIAIVFLQTSYDDMCKYAEILRNKIYNEFDWFCNIGYETKNRTDVNELFISNTNHIKGLEFPFVLAISLDYISDDLHSRNSIYMALTRSFIKSIFFINSSIVQNRKFIDIYKAAIVSINENKKIIIAEPSEEDKKNAKKRLGSISKATNRENVLNKLKNDFGLSETEIEGLKNFTESLSHNKELDDIGFYSHCEKLIKQMRFQS